MLHALSLTTLLMNYKVIHYLSYQIVYMPQYPPFQLRENNFWMQYRLFGVYFCQMLCCYYFILIYKILSLIRIILPSKLCLTFAADSPCIPAILQNIVVVTHTTTEIVTEVGKND
jgi:hypothetical protein